MYVRTCFRRCWIFFRSVKVRTHCLFVTLYPSFSLSYPFVPSVLFTFLSFLSLPLTLTLTQSLLPLSILALHDTFLLSHSSSTSSFSSLILLSKSVLTSFLFFLLILHLLFPFLLLLITHSKDLKATDDSLTKEKMKSIFGKGKAKKDGTESLVKGLPPVRDLQTNIGERRSRYSIFYHPHSSFYFSFFSF